MSLTTVTFSVHVTPDKRHGLIHEFVSANLGTKVRVQEFELDGVWRGTLIGVALVVNSGNPVLIIDMPSLMRTSMRAIPFNSIRMLEVEEQEASDG